MDEVIRKVGIVVEPEACMGALCNENGEVELIENGAFDERDFENSASYELEYRAGVRGYDNLLNAGIAISDIGIAIQRIIHNISFGFKEERIHAAISLPSVIPTKEEIENYIEEERLFGNVDADRKFSADVYKTLDLKYLENTYEILKRGAEQCSLEKFIFVHRAIAVAYAYEYGETDAMLMEGQYGIIYDWGKNYFSAAIVEKYDGEIELCWTETIDNPGWYDAGYYESMNWDQEKFMDCFGQTMDVVYQMCQRSGYDIENVSAVYLAGEYCGLHNVVNELQDRIGKVKTMGDTRLAVLRGATLIADRWDDYFEE